MSKKYSVTIVHLYPGYMNIYGDMGNIIALKKRCEWRKINVTVKKISLNDDLPEDTDIYFMGGGQDQDQITVFKDLQKKKGELFAQIDEGVCFLAICGAYQLLGKYFVTGSGKSIEGIGLLDVVTKAPGTDVKIRCIGNVVARLNDEMVQPDMPFDTVVGFENHSGQTTLGSSAKPLGYISTGYGNNVLDDTEGCVYKNVIGTYLHGSFLPKNPHIADWLISNTLKRKYGDDIVLEKLDDGVEIRAHDYAANLR